MVENEIDQDVRLKVSDLILHAEQAGAAFLSHSEYHLVDSIVKAALESFGAAAASIALVDVEEEYLIFTVAHGAGNEEVTAKKIPLDVGIAAYVLLSGEPLYIEDVHQDTRFHHSFAESTGYMPSSILAAPLRWADEIIGVMEVLDTSPEFRPLDVQLGLLSLFAGMASSAIVQWQHSLLMEVHRDRGSSKQEEPDQPKLNSEEDFTIPIGSSDRKGAGVDDLLEGYRILRELKGSERRLGVTILRRLSEHFRGRTDLNG